MPSARFRHMKSAVRRIERGLLPRSIHAGIIDLSPRLSLRGLSYRVLCHAEIEQYLEDRVVEIAGAADSAWKSRRHTSLSTFSLLAFSGRNMLAPPETIAAPPRKKQSDWSEYTKPDKRLSVSISHYIDSVRNRNHGIKEVNLVAMMLPVGLSPDKLDEAFLVEMKDFGVKRGAAAHASIAGHVTAGVNPRDEIAQVARILQSIIPIDEELDILLQRAR